MCMEIVTSYLWEKNGRRENEDAIGLRQYSYKKESCGIAIVCDGIGGLSEGETASSFVVNDMLEAMERLVRKGKKKHKYIRNYFFRQIYMAHRKLIHYGKEQNIRLGTTLCMVVWMKKTAYLFYVGDSNAYVGKKELRRYTKQHSSVKNQLKRAVGVGEYKTPSFRQFRLKNRMKVLLCTDGYDRRAGNRVMYVNSEKEVRQLYELVLARGEMDNVSCIYLEWRKNYGRSKI